MFLGVSNQIGPQIRIGYNNQARNPTIAIHFDHNNFLSLSSRNWNIFRINSLNTTISILIGSGLISLVFILLAGLSKSKVSNLES